jgi:hypothetical protein
MSPPKNASMTLSIHSSYTEELKIIIKLKTENPKSPTKEVLRLPILSDIAPPKSCPVAKPNKKSVKVSSILSILTTKYSAMDGIDGIYVSIDIGAIEESAANITISSLWFFVFIINYSLARLLLSHLFL